MKVFDIPEEFALNMGRVITAYRARNVASLIFERESTVDKVDVSNLVIEVPSHEISESISRDIVRPRNGGFVE